MIKKIFNFIKALIKHLLNRCRYVTIEEYIFRIEACNECGYREKNICNVCGCYVDKKAWWDSEDCPKKKWIRE